MTITSSACRIYDLSDKLVREISSKNAGLFSFDALHFANFLDGIREGKPLRAEIEESTLLCHLGNIALRSGHTINFDSKTHKIVGDRSASALWGRKYRKGWEPKV
jgi:hypothetical protein